MKTNKSLLIGLLGIAVLGLASCSAMDNVRGWFEKDETSAHPVKGQAGHYYLVGDKSFAGQENLAWKVQGGYEATEDKNGTDLAQFLNVKIKKNTAVKILKFVDGDNDIWFGDIGATYDFCGVVDSNITFTKEGTYNFYLNSSSVIYITAMGE